MMAEEAVEIGLIDGVEPSVHHLMARVMEERRSSSVWA